MSEYCSSGCPPYPHKHQQGTFGSLIPYIPTQKELDQHLSDRDHLYRLDQHLSDRDHLYRVEAKLDAIILILKGLEGKK